MVAISRIPGVMRPDSPGKSIASRPLSPKSRRVFPSANTNGATPMPIRLERWMRSKVSAMTGRPHSNFAPFPAPHHLVLDADVGKCPTHHHFVISPPRSVGIEIRIGNPAVEEIFAGG